MTNDLSTRLLQAVEEREKAAHLTDAALVPALCKAHREIVELHLVCQAGLELAATNVGDVDGTTREQRQKARDDFHDAGVRLQLSDHIVSIIARGYGMGEET